MEKIISTSTDKICICFSKTENKELRPEPQQRPERPDVQYCLKAELLVPGRYCFINKETASAGVRESHGEPWRREVTDPAVPV